MNLEERMVIASNQFRPNGTGDHGDFPIEFHSICDIYIIFILVCYYRYTVKWFHEQC